MSDTNPTLHRPKQPEKRLWDKMDGIVIGLVAGIIMWIADPNAALVKGLSADGTYYNLLVEGFRAGHLYVNREPPPGLAQVSDPYNPADNSAIIGSANDLSYFKGKLYMYFGVTPALVLCWPYVALTGHYISDRAAVAVFFAVGMALIAGLLSDIRRRYFPETSPWLVRASALSLGLMLGLTLSGSVYEVAVVCGFAFIMLSLVALWRALHEPQRQVLWLALASLAYGLAIGARPSLLFSIIILLIPAAHLCRQPVTSPAKAGLLLAAAAGPAMFIGLALMIYNDQRFGSPFEFGWHYQLIRDYDPMKAHQFSLNYFWFNFRNYFLEPFECTARFPFLRAAPPLQMPAGYSPGPVAVGGAIWCRYPLAWLVLALPLALAGNPGQAFSSLRWFAAALFLLSITTAFVLCLFLTQTSRYELDFLPAWLILAVIGFLGAERVTASSQVWRSLSRAFACLLFVASIALSLMANIEGHAISRCFCGNVFLSENRFDDAMVQYKKALALWPGYTDARDGLGNALLGEGRLDDAMVQYQKAIELEPQSADARERYGDALFQKGLLSQAVGQYQMAAELKPDFAQAHENLGTCFAKSGRLDQAIVEYQQAVKLQPDLMGPYYCLGNVFQLKGMAAEAVTNYQKAIELAPEFIPAQINLASLLATSHDPAIRNADQAATLMESASRATAGNDPQVLRTLAIAYAQTGRYSEATTAAKKALAIATAGSNKTLMNKLQSDIRQYQAGSPGRSTGD
ncbi:MAG TPA: tetratricopeptide repeat protein [Alphaproteobacteria bacterium]|nr:tetratricopeptide repeat protein [Alphaproteobacteria bacterium]